MNNYLFSSLVLNIETTKGKVRDCSEVCGYLHYSAVRPPRVVFPSILRLLVVLLCSFPSSRTVGCLREQGLVLVVKARLLEDLLATRCHLLQQPVDSFHLLVGFLLINGV